MLIITFMISSDFVIFGSTVTQEKIISAISIAAATALSTLPATRSPVRVPAAIAGIFFWEIVTFIRLYS